MSFVKGYERLLQHKEKVISALLKASLEEIPIVGLFFRTYQEVQQDLDLKHLHHNLQDQHFSQQHLNQKFETLLKTLNLDENLFVAIENASEEDLIQSFSASAKSLSLPFKQKLSQKIKQLETPLSLQEKKQRVQEICEATLGAFTKTLNHTRSSVVGSLHFRKDEEKIFQPADVLQNRYEILELIGWGGMGTVYKMKDRILNHVRALKTIQLPKSNPAKFQEKFYEEVRLATSLTDPHILRVHDIGFEENTLFLTMEWIKGVSLNRVLLEQGTIPLKQAYSIILDVAKAIQTAHNQHILHLDIKPANIMVENSGKTKLVDFGLAKLLNSKEFTQLSQISGTIGYMAPEQQDGFSVGKASDIYSLAVVFYQMLSGFRPQGFFETPTHFCPEMPEEISNLIIHSLHRDLNKRPENIKEWITILEKQLSPKVVASKPLSTVKPTLPRKPEVIEILPKTQNQLYDALKTLHLNWNDYYQLILQQDKRQSQNGIVISLFNKSHSYLQEAQDCQKAFHKYATFVDIPIEQRKLIGGFGGGSSLYFGSMLGAGLFKNIVVQDPMQIAKYLDAIPITGTFSKKIVFGYLKGICNLRGISLGGATRLLAVKRPDLFLPLNGGNRKKIQTLFGMVPKSEKEYLQFHDHYIWKQRWYRAECPKNKREEAIWKIRVALLDALFFD